MTSTEATQAALQELIGRFGRFGPDPVAELSPADNAVSHVLVDGQHAVVLGVFTQTLRATGHRFATPVALHMTVEDGHITRFGPYEDSHAVSRAYARQS